MSKHEKTEEQVVNVRKAIAKAEEESSSESSSCVSQNEHSNSKHESSKSKKVDKDYSDSSFSEDKKGKKVHSSQSKGNEIEKKKKHENMEFTEQFLEKHVGEIDRNRLDTLRNGTWHVPAKGKKATRVEKAQEELQDVIDHYLKGDFSYVQMKEEKEAEQAKFGIRLSFVVNLILLGIKIAVLAMSGSISIFASLLDSILDLVSGSIIFLANWLQKIKGKDYYKYPVGKRRLETLSVIVFASAMFTATGELLIQSVQRLTNPGVISLSFDYVSISLVALIIVIKFVLWLICRRADVPTVQAVAQDHINDVFTNAIGILCAVLGYYFWPMLDPVGGLILGIFIMMNWAGTGIENVKLMTGKSADPDFLSIITQLAACHHPKVKAVDTVRAYFVSNRLIVELDIILPEEIPLKEAHDIGESLQNKIEKLTEIERAFVHLDFEDEHRHLDEHPTLEKLHARFKTQEQIQLEDDAQKPF